MASPQNRVRLGATGGPEVRAAAALLIHDLEKAALETVLQIGSGGDYLVRMHQLSTPIQIETSAMARHMSADAPAEARKRRTNTADADRGRMRRAR